jgi:hypothetical protein
MRHQTTGYDTMIIPRVKGKRREVRRLLARRSQDLLARYRWGEALDPVCPLKKALDKREKSTSGNGNAPALPFWNLFSIKNQRRIGKGLGFSLTSGG